MKILFKDETFSVKRFEMQAGEVALEFSGEGEEFSIPYCGVKDFCITQDRLGRSYFMVSYDKKMCEGKILNEKEIASFISTLRDKLDGVIRTIVQRS